MQEADDSTRSGVVALKQNIRFLKLEIESRKDAFMHENGLKPDEDDLPSFFSWLGEMFRHITCIRSKEEELTAYEARLADALSARRKARRAAQKMRYHRRTLEEASAKLTEWVQQREAKGMRR